MNDGVLNTPSPVLPVGASRAHRLGFGSMQLTGPGHWAAPDNPEQAMQVLRDAVDAGVTHIDTADAYGPFTAENYIRKALHPYRDGLVIATKGGLTRQGPDRWAPCGRPEYLRQCVEMSLRRLQVERIDLYYLHRIDPAIPLEDQLAVLVEMQNEGKIHHIGLSKVTVSQICRARELVIVAAVQNKYSVGNRVHEDVLQYCTQHEIPFIPYAPLAAGQLLHTDGRLARLSESRGITPAQLALAWLLNASPAMMPIPGTSRTVHLAENLSAAQIDLDTDELDEIARATARRHVAHPRRRDRAAAPTARSDGPSAST
ncbi:aldo/keto reductase [Amycolatopsis vastitatis]|uniref:Aldo/keto reductase n=1 Tax=Amycolatopsis vastitatis TaxID=1905142 RepID=A0A229SKA3_9PSEU|nr:aldo/keto reductase [Amycolatopsis vastitatis]OXM59154.1 aldo/keto reductase [Amycolatopsis vastitatis]